MTTYTILKWIIINIIQVLLTFSKNDLCIRTCMSDKNQNVKEVNKSS